MKYDWWLIAAWLGVAVVDILALFGIAYAILYIVS